MDKDNKPLSELEQIAASSNETSVEMPKKVDDTANAPSQSSSPAPVQNQPTNAPAPAQSAPKSAPAPSTPNVAPTQSTQSQPTTSTPSVKPVQSVATTIGTIKPDKQKSPLSMVFLFGLLVIFVLFMPQILTFVNEQFNLKLETHTGAEFNDNTSTKTPTQEEDKSVNDNKMYDLLSTTSIDIDKISFGGFNKGLVAPYQLSFYVKNNGSVPYKFEKKVYFDYYDDSNTLVGSSYLESIKEISGGVQTTFLVDINDNIYLKATKLKIVERTEDDYPTINLKANSLTCTRSNRVYDYTFDNNQKLLTIKDSYTYTKTEDDLKYNTDLVSYKASMSNLDAIDGVTAVLTETDTGFITTVLIDYSVADYQKISSNNNYYIKDTLAKTIKYEISAKGYICE
ncbi:MAG: hypothetical protein IJ572_01745 [Bacilli bacterium]|nr:hypothetical protein [Bacilli bacterium]